MLKKYFQKDNIKIAGILLLPLFVYIGVNGMVTYNQNSICLFKYITGFECWGCGITRAFDALFQFQFQKAFEFNPRIIIVAPLLFWIWLATLKRALSQKNNQHKIESTEL